MLPKYGDSWIHKYNNFLKKELDLSNTDSELSFNYKHNEKTKVLQATMAVYVDAH